MLNETDETFKLIRNEIVDVTNFFINDCLYGKSSEVFKIEHRTIKPITDIQET